MPTSVSSHGTLDSGERVLREERFQEHPSRLDSIIPTWGVTVK